MLRRTSAGPSHALKKLSEDQASQDRMSASAKTRFGGVAREKLNFFLPLLFPSQVQPQQQGDKKFIFLEGGKRFGGEFSQATSIDD